MYIPVSIALKEAMYIVSFMRQNHDDPLPYKLENYTKYQIEYMQWPVSNTAEFVTDRLRPAKFRNDSIIPDTKFYTWDEESAQHSLKITVCGIETLYPMDTIGE